MNMDNNWGDKEKVATAGRAGRYRTIGNNNVCRSIAALMDGDNIDEGPRLDGGTPTGDARAEINRLWRAGGDKGGGQLIGGQRWDQLITGTGRGSHCL